MIFLTYCYCIKILISGKRIMNVKQRKRLNLLSEKVADERASYSELNEFKELLNAWNDSIELNFPAVMFTANDINFK